MVAKSAAPAFNLAAIMSFLNSNNQPVAKAPDIRSLMLPIPGAEQHAAQVAARRQAESMAAMAPQIYGNAPTIKDIAESYAMDPMERMADEPTIPGLQTVTQEQVPGTGIYDESKPIQQRMMEMNQRMLASGNPGFAKQWSQNQGNMQNANMTALSQIAKSKFDLANPGMSANGKKAIDAGFIPGTVPYKNYVNKLNTMGNYESSQDKPYGPNDISKYMTPDGRSVSYGTPAMVRSGQLVLRNTMNKGDAGGFSQVEAAVNALPALRANLFMDDGSINEEAVGDMWVKNLVSTMPAFVSTAAQPILNKYMSPAGQQLASSYEQGIQAITRAETGAAMPDTEIGNTRGRFLPEPNEDTAVSAWKYNAYETLLKNAKSYMSPILRGRDKSTITEAERIKMVNQAIDRAFADTPRPAGGSTASPPQTLQRNTDGTFTDPVMEAEFQKQYKGGQ